MTEQEKMLAGKIYDPSDEALVKLRTRAHGLCMQYNNTLEEEEERRSEILHELLPNSSSKIAIQGPIYIDYGVFTYMGENVYANFNLTILDTCPVNIGNDVFFGPGCYVCTPVHPLKYAQRKMKTKPDGTVYDDEYGKPITIERGVWLASNVTVCGGVTIGEGSVIGAGSVVTRNIPPYTFAAGNPCRVIREITDRDGLEFHPELF